MKNKAIIAMSGGVDSAVTAYLMKEDGYDAHGITLRLCGGNEDDNSCCTERDIADAKAVCDKIGIGFSLLDYKTDFTEKVIASFAEGYASGETPNPCVECNREIKFAHLCDMAKKEGSCVATGHYVIREYSEKYGRAVLKKASDITKDQSYVLWQLTPEQVEISRFPLGRYTKSEVRQIAEQNGFVNSQKKDSQDICFIKDGNYSDFVERFLGKSFEEGNFVTTDGKVLGKHKGIIRYTVGQRKGLGLALPSPLYVKEKRMEDNTVVLSPEDKLFSHEMYCDRLNFQAIDKIKAPIRALVKNRYRHTEMPATVEMTDSGLLKVTYDEAQRAVTPGQSAVVYDFDGVLLCGGKIRYSR